MVCDSITLARIMIDLLDLRWLIIVLKLLLQSLMISKHASISLIVGAEFVGRARLPSFNSCFAFVAAVFLFFDLKTSGAYLFHPMDQRFTHLIL